MRSIAAFAAGVTLLSSLCAASSSAASPSGGFGAFDSYIRTALREYHVPGAAVAVVENGKTVFLKGYGVADLATGAKVDANTVFQLASVSKTFTGVAGAILVDRGKLKWDAPIVTYLPQFAAYDAYATRHLTMRDLLAHRTGWPKFAGDLLGDFGYSRSETVRRLRYLKPAHSLRDVAQYSNPAFFLAGEVEARVAGMPWDTFVQRQIFTPLAMSRTSIGLHGLPAADVAQPYTLVDGVARRTTRSDSDTFAAAGGVNSSAADMAHYLQFWLSGGSYRGTSIVKPASIAEIFKRSMVGEIDFSEMPPISEATGFYYGLGVGSYDYAGQQIVEKGGALSGFRTLVTLVPSKHAGIAILCNLNLTAFPEAVRTYYLEKMLLGKSPSADLAEIAKRNAQLSAMLKPVTPPPHAKPFRGSLAKLDGTYENPLYGRCVISLLQAAESMSCGPAKYRAAVTHYDKNVFLARWPGATSLGDLLDFKLGPSGNAVSFTDDALGTFTRVR
jgi:CubicO group peptidase (beta-lactamase class C family)